MPVHSTLPVKRDTLRWWVFWWKLELMSIRQQPRYVRKFCDCMQMWENTIHVCTIHEGIRPCDAKRKRCGALDSCFRLVGPHQQSIPQLLSLASRVYKGYQEHLWFWTNEIHPHKVLPLVCAADHAQTFMVWSLGPSPHAHNMTNILFA